MSLLPHRSLNRRGFLVAGARTGVMLALATFAAWQETKRRRLANDPNCLKLSVCSECVEFGRCPKPRAQSARANRSL